MSVNDQAPDSVSRLRTTAKGETLIENDMPVLDYLYATWRGRKWKARCRNSRSIGVGPRRYWQKMSDNDMRPLELADEWPVVSPSIILPDISRNNIQLRQKRILDASNTHRRSSTEFSVYVSMGRPAVSFPLFDTGRAPGWERHVLHDEKEILLAAYGKWCI